MAFVFGSMASGRQNAGSDIDVCVLGDVSLLDVVTALSPVQETLRRELNPVVMTAERYSELAKRQDRFVTRMMSEPRVIVMADENELAKLVENGTAGRA